MAVAVHNPANIDLSQPRFAAFSGDYKVQVFNSQSQRFENVESTLTCSNDLDKTLQPVYSCFLTVDSPVAAHEVGYFQVDYSKKAQQDETKPIQIGDTLTNGELTVSFKNTESAGLVFDVTDKASGKTEELTFRLAYWLSAVQFDGGDNSGDYVFRPVAEMYKPLPYSKYLSGTISNGKQMDFYFEKYNRVEDNYQRVWVRLTIDSDTQNLKFDVDMDSIPGQKLNGYEVIVEF